MTDTFVDMPVEKLQAGYQVDLADDPSVSCDNDDCNCGVLSEYEYFVVESVEQETPDRTAVVFEQAWIGFPHGHIVRVRAE